MKKLILILVTAMIVTGVNGQNIFKAIIKDGETKEVLIGATAFIEAYPQNGTTSDSNGILELNNIPNGTQVIVISYVGYELKRAAMDFPLPSHETLEILLNKENELEEVIVSSTRTSRTIDNIPTRMEFINGEELEEKSNMKPGDIRMMLNESTGIQTQQTSATSYNSSIRIQGLDGKYTQILRDGFPLYSGFSGGLSLLQIVPLDLEQVEVIKGASSTLYGGGAIAGLVNLISKTPDEKRELNFLLNGTTALGMDASGFYSQKFGKAGTTVFASYNTGKPYDPSNIGFTAIPRYTRYTFNPKVFLFLNNKTTLNVGFNNTLEDRMGGDIKYIEGKGDNIHSYFEKNKTNRFSTQLGFDHEINEGSKISLKNSVSYYNREVEIPDYRFSGNQFSSFSEVTYDLKKDKVEWIGGLNAWTDKFSQNKTDSVKNLDYNYTTLGAFVQNTWDATELITLETGMRADYQNKYGFFLLPRISAMFKFNHKLTLRIGSGLGYKTPTVFTEDAEKIQFRNVLPIDDSRAKAEQSVGANFDINYKTSLSEDIFFTINTLFFYTQVKNPLLLVPDSNGLYAFKQPKGFIDTKGIETNLKLSYNHFKLFIGYTLADVTQHYNGNMATYPLVAKHRFNNVLMYEIEDKLKAGLEAYYYSPQQLNDGRTGKSYWLAGFMIEKLWEHFSVFINFENILDTRQTKFDTIYTGTITQPTFRDIYAPVDGFIVNGGIKIKL